MWLNQLKVAIVQKDTLLLNKLLDDLPSFKDADEIESTLYLLKEAMTVMQSLKSEVGHSLVQIKKNMKFLSSTQSIQGNKLDIIS